MQNRSFLRKSHRNIIRFFSVIVWLLINAVNNAVCGQSAPYGPKVKISAADFSMVASPADTAAGAVFLTDLGSTDFVGNEQGNFSLLYQRFCRVRVLNRRGLDAATITIPLYVDGESKEKVKEVSGLSYNLEGGSLLETKLDTKKNVYTEDQDKNHKLVKFTLPAVKEGTIIEFSYTIYSDFVFNLQPWLFQGAYPSNWSEYNVMMPSFYGYMSLTRGAQDYFIKSERNAIKNFQVSVPSETNLLRDRTESYNISANVTYFRWVMKDVPALTEESYTSSMNNHYSRISFQLAEIKEPFTPKKILSTWPEAAKGLLERDVFGGALTRDNAWMEDKVKALYSPGDNVLTRMQKITEYIRDHFTCTSRSGIWTTKTPETVFRKKEGNVAELNLLLTAMLRAAGIQADPVILSLRHKGTTLSTYPLLAQYNYVVCRSVYNDSSIFMDAAVPGIGFGKLPADCYNGHARVINETADELNLSADLLLEKSFTSVIASNETNGDLGFTMTRQPGYYESIEMKKTLRAGGTGALGKEMQQLLDPAVTIGKITIDSASGTVAGISADMIVKKPAEDILYLDPMLGQGYKKNPFASASRLYPVEMPYKIEKTYQLSMEIPAGYVVDEMPASIKIKLNEKGDGIFEYKLSSSGGYITLRSWIMLNRTNFLPSEYELLREFFNQVVKKQAAQVVFKKKS
ncbi:MAG: hypothetical protein NTW29_18900 [Bacteroidetes bacterium]|nr:hypothetical protein [Bacteroidota bacterium]